MHSISLLLALLITMIWGANFTIVKFCLNSLSPFVLCFLRFFFASLPLIFFVPRPQVRFAWIFFYGIIMFAVQFTLLFLGLYLGMDAGLTSLLLQLQVFFGMFIGIFFFKEKIRPWHVVGCATAFLGIGIVIGHIDQKLNYVALIPIVGAALCSSIGNLLSKKVAQVNPISLVCWGSLVAWPFLFLSAVFFEGYEPVIQQITNLQISSLLGVLYIAFLSTIFAYGTWCWLVANYPLRTITPFTLLTPIFALLVAAIFLDEPLLPWKLFAASLVITGLAINLFGHRIVRSAPPID